MVFGLKSLLKAFGNDYRQQRSREGFKAERQGIAELKRTAPQGKLVIPAKTNRKDVDFWVIRKDPEGKTVKQPFQWKNVSSYGPINKALKKAPNVPVVVNRDCMKKISDKKK